MMKWWPFIVAVVVLLALIFLPEEDGQKQGKVPIAVVSSTVSKVERPAPAPTDADESQGSPLALQLNAPDGTPQQDVDALLGLIRQYHEAMQRREGPPIGNDADLARVLKGKNPLRLVVVPAMHPVFSPDGRMRDRWGTPYHLHGKGRGAYEVRSSGPDKRLFTPDDVIGRPGAGIEP